MEKNISKFAAFAASHPRLFNSKGLFGGINRDHTALRLFIAHLKEHKIKNNRISNNSFRINAFVSYLNRHDDAKTPKYAPIIKQINSLYEKGYLHDRNGKYDLYEFATILDELGLDTVKYDLVSNTYNDLLKQALTYDKPQVASATPAGASGVPTTEPSASTAAPSASSTPQPSVATKAADEAPASSGYYGSTGLGYAAGTSTSASVQANLGTPEKQKLTVGIDRTATVDSQYSPAGASLPAESTEPIQSEQQAPNPLTGDENNIDLSTPLPPENKEKFLALEPLLAIAEAETEALPLAALESTAEGFPESSEQFSVQVKHETTTQAPARVAKSIRPNTGTTKITLLDTISGLRQKTTAPNNFAAQQNAQLEEQNELEQALAQQSRQQEIRRKAPRKKKSAGRKLLGNVSKGFGGLAAILGASGKASSLALLPSISDSAQVLKKIITIALFSLIIAVNVPLISGALPTTSEQFTAYAAAGDPAPVPAAQCPPGFTGAPAQTPTSCTKENPGAADKCIAPFTQETKTAAALVCSMPAADAASIANQEQIKNFTEVIIAIQHFLNVVIWPVLVMIGGLMDNSLLFGGGMEERLRDIWIPMRNLVNILFVIVLVGVALYNVLGIGEEGGSYSIKSLLPKIIVGIIAVNFSFLGIKVVLDATNAITTAIFTLPAEVNVGLSGVLTGKTPKDIALEKRLCAQIQGQALSEFPPELNEDKTPNPNFAAKLATLKDEYDLTLHRDIANKYIPDRVNLPGTKTASTKEQILKEIDLESAKEKPAITREDFDKEVKKRTAQRMCDGLTLTKNGRNFLKEWNSRSAALALALNMGNIVFYDEVKLSVDTIDKLFINTLFSMIMYIIYVASFIALFIVLLGRILFMWICVAMSPILILIMASEEVKSKVGDSVGKLADQFTKNAIAPIIIAISMTVGWIMLHALRGLNNIGTSSTVTLMQVMPNNGIPVSGLSTLSDLIVALGTIGVVWIGVFSAAEGTIAESAVGVLKESLSGAGKWLGKLPFKHLPMVPINLPGQAPGQKFSLGDVTDTIQKLTQAGSSQNKLWDALQPGGAGVNERMATDPTGPVQDKDSLYKFINSAHKADRLKDPKFTEELKKSQSSRPEIWRDVDPDVRRKIDALIATPSQTNAEAVVNALDRGKKVSAFGEMDKIKPAATPPAAPTPPSTTPKVAPVASMPDPQIRQLTIGGRKVDDLLKEPAFTDADAPKEIEALKTSATDVSAVLARIDLSKGPATPGDLAALKDELKGLRVADGDLPLNEAELKTILEPTDAKKVIDIFGGQPKYATMIGPLSVTAKQEALAARTAAAEAAAEEERARTR